jgi:CoA-transferase family III
MSAIAAIEDEAHCGSGRNVRNSSYRGQSTSRVREKCPVYDIDEIFSDPQIINRELFTEMNHPVAGIIKQFGFPIKFSQTPGKIYSHSPLLGEHTEEVLEELGFSTEKIDDFRNKGVIGNKAIQA